MIVVSRLVRVEQERQRLAELTALRRPLTDDEAAEVLLLDERERRRATNRRWRERHQQKERERTRQWQRFNADRVREYRRWYRQQEVIY